MRGDRDLTSFVLPDCARCLRQPVAAKYWLTVLLFYFYLPASVLEPFGLGSVLAQTSGFGLSLRLVIGN